MQAQPVLEVISHRLTYRNLGVDKQADGHKLCLAVEGGAMRGIVSMGMLLALRDLKMLDVFDVYTGVSAGGLNLAYLLAGQGALGLSVYFDDMTKTENLSLRRARGKHAPILDMRTMYTKALRRKALDLPRLRAGRYTSALHVAVSNVTTNASELISPAQAGNRFEEYLVAGATPPVVSGEPWKIHNQDYYDGGLFYADPSQAAEVLGATHTLVLNTTYQGYELKSSGLVNDYIIRRLREQYPAAAELFSQSLINYAQVYDRLPWGETSLDRMHMYRHALKHKGQVGRVTTDPAKLLHDVRAGYQSILDLFAPGTHAGIVPSLLNY